MHFSPERMNSIMAQDKGLGSNVIADVSLKFVIRTELKSLQFIFLSLNFAFITPAITLWGTIKLCVSYF